MRSGNPALSERALQSLPWEGPQGMTLDGAVNKAVLSVSLTFAAALFSWWLWFQDSPWLGLLIGVGSVGGFVVALVTIFKKAWAPATTPVYCVLEGLALGGISALAEQAFPGIVMRAIVLTFGVVLAMLAAYRTGLIKATRGFTLGVAAATGGIALVYLTSLILGLFGLHWAFLQDSSPFGLAFGLFVVVIAALNLVIDFGFIARLADSGAPKYMEWYGAFSLMVTLVWLYVEVLHLLTRLQGSRRE